MKISNKITEILARAKGISETDDQYGVLNYGVVVLYRTIWKTALVFAVAIFMCIWIELSIFFAVYCILRTFGCGIHLKNEFLCTATGFITYIGGVYLAKMTIISLPILLIVFAAVFVLYFLYAPAGTKYRPIGKSRVKKLKILSLLSLVLFYILSVMTGEGVIRNLIVYASLAQCLNVLPITYLIFREGRPKDYEKDA